MHELAIAESVVDTVAQRLPGARITQVRLEIGALSGVVADSIRFCFDLATEGTSLAGATLEITEPPHGAGAVPAAPSSSRTRRSCCATAAARTSPFSAAKNSRSSRSGWCEMCATCGCADGTWHEHGAGHEHGRTVALAEKDLGKISPGATVLPVSARAGDGIGGWYDWLRRAGRR